MRYQEKIIPHNKKETGGFPFKEAIVNVEFSQGDLIELRKILNKNSDDEWSKSLLSDIEATLKKVDYTFDSISDGYVEINVIKPCGTTMLEMYIERTYSSGKIEKINHKFEPLTQNTI